MFKTNFAIRMRSAISIVSLYLQFISMKDCDIPLIKKSACVAIFFKSLTLWNVTLNSLLVLILVFFLLFKDTTFHCIFNEIFMLEWLSGKSFRYTY